MLAIADAVAGAEQCAGVRLASTNTVAEAQMTEVVVVDLDDKIEVDRTALQQITLHRPGLEQSAEAVDQSWCQTGRQRQCAIPSRQRPLRGRGQLREQKLRIWIGRGVEADGQSRRVGQIVKGEQRRNHAGWWWLHRV